MEWVQVVSSLVADVGFPVTACCGIFYLLYKQMKDTEKRDSEYQRIISENTAAVNSLRDLVQTLHREG